MIFPNSFLIKKNFIVSFLYKRFFCFIFLYIFNSFFSTFLPVTLSVIDNPATAFIPLVALASIYILIRTYSTISYIYNYFTATAAAFAAKTGIKEAANITAAVAILTASSITTKAAAEEAAAAAAEEAAAAAAEEAAAAAAALAAEEAAN